MQFRKKLLLSAMLSTAAATSAFADSQITIIQTGDFHGHLAPRPNLRSTADYPGQMVGGLARVAAKIKEIQAGKGGVGNSLLLHTGDTIQGSGEALYTRGQALVDVVDMLGIDNFAPGNWDYVYGKDRFIEIFGNNGKTLPAQAQGNPNNKKFGNRWGALASNLYYTSNQGGAPLDPTLKGSAQDTNLTKSEYDTYTQWYVKHGERVLPPYSIKTINGVKVGILGCTTSRGPQVVGKWVTTGLEFTDCSNEIPMFAEQLRAQGAQIVVLISEIEIGRNIRILKDNISKPEQHIDLVLNSDMHEETLKPIEVIDGSGNKTWITEAGQDGTLINEITLSVHDGQIVPDASGNLMQHKAHRVDDRIAEDQAVAHKVEQVRAPFNEAFDASIPCSLNSPYVNPFTVMEVPNVTDADVTCLSGPLSDVVGSTEVALHRNNYSHENMPAVIEGSSHDFIADAMRWWAKSDMATVRGFRYGTHVAPGPITRNDLFHFVPVGPRVGKVSRISANQLRNQVDNASMAVFSNDPNNAVTPRPSYNNAYGTSIALANTLPGADLPVKGGAGNSLGFGGGWLFAYSADGFHMDFDPYFLPSWQTVKPGSVPAPVAPATTSASGIYLADNAQINNPGSDTSRARNLSVNMSCSSLPAQDKTRHDVGWNGETKNLVTFPETGYAAGLKVIVLNNDVTCAVGGTGYGKTVITKAKDGSYMPSWTATYAAGTEYTPYLLNPDGWQFLNGTPNQPGNPTNAATLPKVVNQPFKAPLFTAAGYWFKQSPNTVNNCNNCYPGGKNVTVGDANAAYVLPVNVKDGVAALDANGNPMYKRDPVTNAVIVGADNKPVVDGDPIDLTTVIEKYLASLVKVTADNMPSNRISVVTTTYALDTTTAAEFDVKPVGNVSTTLPDYTATLGFPVMQPLCGTIAKKAVGLFDELTADKTNAAAIAAATNCPQ